MDKYEYIVNLAEKTAKRVSQNRESWMKFLTSAARIYGKIGMNLLAYMMS